MTDGLHFQAIDWHLFYLLQYVLSDTYFLVL